MSLENHFYLVSFMLMKQIVRRKENEGIACQDCHILNWKGMQDESKKYKGKNKELS